MILNQTMERISIRGFFLSIILLLQTANSTDKETKQSLLNFFQQLSSNGNRLNNPSMGWNDSSDPCSGGGWYGIDCEKGFVKKIRLMGLGLNGTLDAHSLCAVQSLKVLNIQNNSIRGEMSGDISNCMELARLHVNNNQISGDIPASLSSLNNLKRLDVSNNNFSGELPDLSNISGLKTFFGQINQFSGRIPEFNFPNLDEFNISFNQFSGPIPDSASRFDVSSFSGNSGLCGKPLPNTCPTSASPKKRSKIRPGERVLMFLGYIILGTILIAFAFLMFTRKKTDAERVEGGKKEATEADINSSSVYIDYKAEGSKSEYSIPLSAESAMMSTSLIVPMNSAMKDLKFEDLLKAPAELLGRGKFSSMYKVIFEGKGNLAVKRIKDWAMSSGEFRVRMEKIDQVHHRNVLPLLAFYSSNDEKLVVYEYQPNGSLLKLLHGKFVHSSLKFSIPIIRSPLPHLMDLKSAMFNISKNTSLPLYFFSFKFLEGN